MANGWRQWDRNWGGSREEKAASEESMAAEVVTKEDPESDSEEACPVIMLTIVRVYDSTKRM